MPPSCWKSLSYTWKHVVLTQTSVSFIMASACKTDRPYSVSLLWSLLLMTCRALSTGTVVKRLTSNLMRVSRDWRLTDFNKCMKWPEFLTKDSDFPAVGLNILWRKPARALQKEPVELIVCLRGMSDLWILRKSRRCVFPTWLNFSKTPFTLGYTQGQEDFSLCLDDCYPWN
jgi:hypothetical protein